MIKQPRVEQSRQLEQSFADEAARLREEADLLPPGQLREHVLRRARQAETGSHVTDWLGSPGLRPPT